MFWVVGKQNIRAFKNLLSLLSISYKIKGNDIASNFHELAFSNCTQLYFQKKYFSQKNHYQRIYFNKSYTFVNLVSTANVENGYPHKAGQE